MSGAGAHSSQSLGPHLRVGAQVHLGICTWSFASLPGATGKKEEPPPLVTAHQARYEWLPWTYPGFAHILILHMCVGAGFAPLSLAPAQSQHLSFPRLGPNSGLQACAPAVPSTQEPSCSPPSSLPLREERETAMPSEYSGSDEHLEDRTLGPLR